MFTLRPYQREAVESVRQAWKRVNSVLVEMATGCGKTVLFSELAAEAEGRVLVVCPFIPLIGQAAQKIRKRTGIMPDIEQAENRSNESSWGRNKFVVASKSSLLTKYGEGIRAERLQDISTVVFDEAHLGVAGIKRLIDVYTPHGAKFLLVTATPKRHDKIGLHNIAEECCYQYGVVDAINDGWLVSPRAKAITVTAMDLSGVDIVQTKHGKDFSPSQLAKVLEEEKTVVEISEIVAREYLSQKTVVYCESVEQARKVADRLYDVHGVNAKWICSDEKRCSRNDRETAMRLFTDEGSGVDVLCNVDILSTGWDYPPLQHIVMASPTRSLARYTQRLGRGTRPLDGVVDFAGSTPESRKAAIANSAKPFFRVTDLVDATLEHKITTVLDVLGGRVLPEAVEKAKEEAAKQGKLLDVEEALKAAEKDIEEQKRKAEEAARLASIRKRLAALEVYVNAVDRQVDVFDRRTQVGGLKQAKGKMTFPFGKHKGRTLDEIPTGYLKWARETCKEGSWLLKGITAELDRRGSHFSGGVTR